MAYASAVALAPKSIVRSGMPVEENMVAPTGTHGNKMVNDGRTFYYVINNSASDVTVTINTPGSLDGQAVEDLVITIKATGDANGLDKQFIGPFSSTFQQSVKGCFACSSLLAQMSTSYCLMPQYWLMAENPSSAMNPSLPAPRPISSSMSGHRGLLSALL